MSLQVTDSGPPILFEEFVIDFKSTFCSKFYQQSSENQFQINWCQLFMNINFFSNNVELFFLSEYL